MSDLFAVPEAWKKRALMTEAQYEAAYAEAKADPDGYWRKAAARLTWAKLSPSQKSINALTSETLTDIGAGATFYSCLVEIEREKTA